MACWWFNRSARAVFARAYAWLRDAVLGAARSVDDDIAFGSGWGVGLMPPKAEADDNEPAGAEEPPRQP
jgi:hypothetical protein